jgi:hypothetical protein
MLGKYAHLRNVISLASLATVRMEEVSASTSVMGPTAVTYTYWRSRILLFTILATPVSLLDLMPGLSVSHVGITVP